MLHAVRERRKARRVPVSMKVGSDEGTPLGFGYASNISRNGLAIEAQALVDPPHPPSEGSMLRLRFKLPESDLVISAGARVVRVDLQPNWPRLALEFVDLSPDFLEEIERFVQRSVG